MKSEKNKARNWVIPKNTSMTPSLHTHTHTYTHTRREQPKDWHWKLTKSPAGCLNRNGIGVPSVLWPYLTFRGSTSGAKGLWSDWGLPVTSVGCNTDSPDRISARACPRYSGAVMPNPGRGKEEEIRARDNGQGFPLAIVCKNMGHSVTSGQNVPWMSCCRHNAFPHTPSTPLSCLIREAPQATKSNSLQIHAKACCSMWHAHWPEPHPCLATPWRPLSARGASLAKGLRTAAPSHASGPRVLFTCRLWMNFWTSERTMTA